MIHCAAVAMLSWVSLRADSLARTASSVYAMSKLCLNWDPKVLMLGDQVQVRQIDWSLDVNTSTFAAGQELP